MNNLYSNNEISEKNNLDDILNLFIERINKNYLNANFGFFVKTSAKVVDSLIDICVKNKINYFIVNHISFSSIKTNFKLELENQLQKYIKKIYPDIELNIKNVTKGDIENWDRVVDILLTKPEPKNKVSFNPTATEYTYETGENHNRKSRKKSKAVKIISFDFEGSGQNELSTEEKIAIYLKIIFIDGTCISELKHTLNLMCLILNNSTMEYDIFNPYKIIK
jgi:hypothetical protein